LLLGAGAGGGDGDGGTPLFCAIIISFTILLLRSAQASAPKSILRLSLKALLAIAKDQRHLLLLGRYNRSKH
jgi:hypothetical protein